MTTPLLHVAIYARSAIVDTDLQPQIDACRTFATAQGWTLASIYADPGCSGLRIDHPAVTRLRRDAAAGHFDIVLCEERGRLSRDMGKLVRLVAELDHAGVNIWTIAEGKMNDRFPAMKRFVQLQAAIRIADRQRRPAAHT